jgi:hypothetical protein
MVPIGETTRRQYGWTYLTNRFTAIINPVSPVHEPIMQMFVSTLFHRTFQLARRITMKRRCIKRLLTLRKGYEGTL